MRRGAWGLALAALMLPATSAQTSRPAPTRLQVADGVYLFKSAPYGDVGLDGNAVVIIGTDGVLVFDTNGTPAAAAAVLAEIRALTPQPVKYVVNSHWHWDHWYGTEVYQQAFPNVQVIAHEATRAMMAGPAIEFNRPGLDTQLPGYLKALEQKLALLDPASADAQRLKGVIDEDRAFLDQKRAVRHAMPTVTYTDRLTLHVGGREIQVRHHDRAVTPGDTFLYLPKEKLVVAGDLLVNPVSFALSCYPTGWLHTLEAIDALDAAVLVPGHGDPLRDERLLHATMDVFRRLLKQGADARARGLDADAAKEEIFPTLRDPMVAITNDVPAVNNAFKTQLVDWYLHRVYDELAGPLSNAIAPIPRQ